MPLHARQPSRPSPNHPIHPHRRLEVEQACLDFVSPWPGCSAQAPSSHAVYAKKQLKMHGQGMSQPIQAFKHALYGCIPLHCVMHVCKTRSELLLHEPLQELHKIRLWQQDSVPRPCSLQPVPVSVQARYPSLCPPAHVQAPPHWRFPCRLLPALSAAA